MKVINVKNGKEVAVAATDLKDMMKKLKTLKTLIAKEDAVIFRERTGWNKYTIQVWLETPKKGAQGHVYDVIEVNRKDLAKLDKLMGSKPSEKGTKITKPELL